VGFEPVDPKVSFPELERRVLGFWREADVFHRQLEQRRDGPEWVFYEGPPTANGRPAIHHTESRTFKDIYPRFKAMTGHLVPRKAGWDCHGLPVELEVEREIGTKSKRDIEAFGIAEFNRLCRESVQRYVGEFEAQTERLGFWIDTDDAYRTMDTEYIESVWWSLKQLHGRGLLVEADRIATYCPRCGTPLSDAEVAMGYADVEDPSVYVGFRLVDAPDPELAGASLLGWTTTPWTLISNAGLAVAPDAPYVVVEHAGERLVIAEALKDAVVPDAPVEGGPLAGSTLVGARYEPLYPNVEGAHRVIAADLVSLEDGTGIVHMAPAFGAADLEVGRREGWAVFKPLDGEGRFTDEAPAFVRGRFFKDADPEIIDDLRARGLLLRAETITHAYPLCWRCDTPLIYFARTSWYIRTTAVKERLLAVNDEVDWHPEHIRTGRYGDWLSNNVDWALSRERYWGTPLPIWRCPNLHDTAIGSLAELSERAGRDVTGIDPHRPAIDEVAFACPECAERSTRLPEVIDTWYDSGAMPFAQWGYHPELGRGLDRFDPKDPAADFIAEAIDQTRGWFYTLMAEGVLLFDSTVYRAVVCLGLLVDGQGRKMSKSLGNTIDAFEVMDRQGADALRWYLLTGGSPWSPRRVSMEAFDEVVRGFLLPLWNVYSFFVTYANAGGFDPSAGQVPLEERPVLDRWIASRLAGTIEAAREELDRYDATGAGRRVHLFLDDLSNWYVRRTRRRFWDPNGTGGRDTTEAFLTLHDVLVTVSQLLAPFTPFVAEELWRNLAAGRDGRPDSVHLSDYPNKRGADRDPNLDDAMASARAIVELGRRVRTESKVKVRQPLLEAVVHFPGDHEALRPILDLVGEELNVKRVVFAESTQQLGGWRAKPNFKTLGPRLGSVVKDVAAALARDDGSLAAALAQGETVELVTPSGVIALGPADVDLTQETVEGWGVASDGGITVALELEITPELRLEGLARELVRVVQDARRAAGLEVSDRIVLDLTVAGPLEEALSAHGDVIGAETLAAEIVRDLGEAASYRQTVELDGDTVTVSLRKA